MRLFKDYVIWALALVVLLKACKWTAVLLVDGLSIAAVQVWDDRLQILMILGCFAAAVIVSKLVTFLGRLRANL